MAASKKTKFTMSKPATAPKFSRKKSAAQTKKSVKFESSSTSSLFDGLTEAEVGSIFDPILAESTGPESRDAKVERIARTMTLAESLQEIRSKIVKK